MQFQGSDYTLEVPDDWQDRSIISFVATVAPSEFAPNVVITKETVDAEMSVEDYANRQFSVTQAEVQGLTVVEQQNITINGRPVVQIVQKISAHGLNLQQLQTFVLANEEIYIVTCTATAASFQQHLPRFKKIAQSLRLNGS
ncbi:MAG: DcrB-related protein [Pyrinomonadaceae bacterium]